MANWDYHREETTFEAKTGKMRCVIVAAEEKVSKSSGKPMIEITVRPSGSNAKVKTYLVKNEKFNQNATTFFDSFPEIGEGNFNLLEWVGAEGAADFGTDDNGYLRVKWFITASRATSLPEFEGEKPAKQEVATLEDEDEGLPWA